MSDYTPPTLVIPTPGGSPGDGSIRGNLTIGDSGDTTSSSNPNLYCAGALVAQRFSSGNSAMLLGYGNNDPTDFPTINASPILSTDSGGDLEIRATGAAVAIILDPSGNIYFETPFKRFGGINTVGLGLSPIYSLDNRTGLTAVDSAAKTLYTTTAAGQLYRLMGRILATAGTSPSATYTIKWTEGGAAITKTLTISALDSDSDLSVLIQPDSGTAITAQLTAISGTGTTVNVAATVEQMA